MARTKRASFQELKEFIKPAIGLRDIPENHRRGPGNLPVIWFNDLTRIAKLYGVKKIIFNPKSDGHFYDPKKKFISIQIDDEMEDWEIFLIFSHELAHRIQDIVDPDRVEKVAYIKYEREAERLGYFVYKAYFNRIFPVHHAQFSYGRSDGDKKYIRKYYAKQ